MPFPPVQPDVRAVLLNARQVVILGASTRPERAAYYVPAYLAAHGFKVISVRPGGRGRLHGGPVLSSLAEIDQDVDVLNIFRRADALSGHIAEVVALHPKTVWLPTGVRAPAAFREAMATHGIGLIENRCMMVDHGMLR